MQFLKFYKGFTLIELLVIIGAVGILSAIILVNIRSSKIKANDARRITEMKQIISAQELYYNDHGKYFSTTTQDGIPQIGEYLRALKDPKYPNHPNYKWLDNTNCEEKFCAFATLEEKGICDLKWFVVYEGGWKEICNPTQNLNSGCDCANL